MKSSRLLSPSSVTNPEGGKATESVKLFVRKQTRSLWRFFSSVRLALILILILTGLSLVGTLVIQVQPEVSADPAEYGWWLENIVRPNLGIWTTPLAFLGLFDVFHSLWFLVAGTMLIVNIVVCSLNRWNGIYSAVFKQRVKLADRFYEGGANRAQFASLNMTTDDAGNRLREVLRSKGYRVRQESAPEGLYVAGDKNRMCRFGTYLHHLSIVLFIAGFLIGSYMGFRARSFAVSENSIAEVGYGTNLSLELESFVDEYWPDGPPKDYRSQVVIYDNGVEVQRGLVRVNHPIEYGGVRFYQSYFGPSAVMSVTDTSDGEVLFSDGVPLSWTSGDEPFKRPTGVIKLRERDLSAYLLAPAQGYFDPMIQAGQIRIEIFQGGSRVPLATALLEPGKPTTLEGMEFNFLRERQFSGFQVVRDPGNNLIWIASTLFVLGLALVFYFPHRQVWARVYNEADGKPKVLLRTTSTKSFAVASDFESMAKGLEDKLSEASAGERTELVRG